MANYSKNRILKCATAAVLSLSMLVTGVGIQSAPADAKSKAPALSAKKVSVAVGKSKKIKVKNVKKNAKVKVTVKKKGVVKAKVKKLNITLTGKKAGKSKVVVKVTYKKGSKKVTKNLKCTVTVKADSSSTATVAPTTAATKAAATASATAAAGTNATAAPGTAETAAADVTAAADATATPDSNAYQTPVVVVTTPKPENKVEKDGAIYGVYASAITQKENALPFTDYDSDEMIKEMGTGINLGNYMDAVSNYMTYPIQVDEKAWNNVTVTKKYFKRVHDLGFSTIRIPVTWALDKTGEINEARLSRVQEFVDYAIEEGLYVVVNVHHDGAPDNCEFQTLIQPYKIADEDDLTDPIYVAYKSSWNYIAERFKNYDEHLIFESMNEVYATWYQTDKNGNIKTDSEGNPKFNNDGYNTDAEDIAPTLNKIMTMNNLFVEAVRGTGSNNAKRWLLCPPINTNIVIATNNYGATEYGFSLPEDTLEDSRIMLSVHDYTDVSVNDLNEEGTRVANRFKYLKEMYVDKGHPVIVGEYGSYSIISGDWYQGSGSEFKQPYTYEAYNYLAKKNDLTILAWDISPLVDRTGNGTTDWD
ncbi:MAG: glycoside hydrolase family 5 protein, partial [Lachnospiraceae bacterium]|nr:glycoside hydrolase family 5 protein [Lachnospiraceae bacterium]